MVDKIRTYAELRTRIREALRQEHPEWVGPYGDSEVCDSYEARFAALLELFDSRARSGNTSINTSA